MLKISAVYLEKQICFIPKKIFSKPRVNRFQYQNNQLCLLSQFSVKVLEPPTGSPFDRKRKQLKQGILFFRHLKIYIFHGTDTSSKI